MQQLKDVTYRHVAKMLAAALPVEGQEFGLQVEANLDAIKRLPQEQKVALKSAYIFSRKVPRQEMADFFQDLALTLLKAKTKDEKLAYAIARCDWKDWYKKYKIRQHFSLDSEVSDKTGNTSTFGELLVGEIEFESKMNGKIDAEHMYDSLPAHIKPIIDKRLIGLALAASERGKLHRFVTTKGQKLLAS